MAPLQRAGASARAGVCVGLCVVENAGPPGQTSRLANLNSQEGSSGEWQTATPASDDSAGHLAGTGADPDRRYPPGNNQRSAAGAPPCGAAQRRAGPHPGGPEVGTAGALEPRLPFVVKTGDSSVEIFREILQALFPTAQLRLGAMSG